MQEDDDVAVQLASATLGPHSGRTRAAPRRSPDQQPSPLSNIAAARIAATPAGHAECSEWSAATVFTCSAVSSVTRNFPSKDVLVLQPAPAMYTAVERSAMGTAYVKSRRHPPFH